MTPSSVPTAAALEARLREVLAPSVLQVIDESAAHAGHAGANGLGYGTHFRVRIAAPAFEGLSRVAQHRLVYDPLRQMITQGVHAIAIEVLPPVHPAATPSSLQASPSQNS